MMKHLDEREFTRALNLYRSLERDIREHQFSEDLYLAFIQSAIRVGKLDVVERMLRIMRRNAMTPSRKFWQTTLKMLSSRKHFSACVSAFSVFGRHLPADKVIFSCLVNAALEVGCPDRAAEVLERFKEVDIEPKDHVLFFRTYVALNDVESAEAIFRKLGKQVSTLMLNLLLLTCTNARQPERGFSLLREAHSFEDPEKGKIVDVVSYNTVIKGFAQVNNPRQCFDCFHDMMERGLEPDDITFGTLLDACIADNHMDIAQQLASLLMASNRTLDTVMCTLFIKGLVRANCLPKALDLYEEMRRRRSAHPDVITYSVLIKALVDQHELDKAFSLVEDMGASGLKPDDIILTHLLDGCRHAGNYTLGKKIFEEMLANGVQPSEFTLVMMLKLLGRCGCHREAHDMVSGWEKQHGMRPSVIHFTCLMSGCLRTKNYDQAWAAYKLMRENDVQPDTMTLSTLLPGMIAAQKWLHVLELAEIATVGGKSVVPSETLNSALSQMMSAGGQRDLADRLHKVMVAAGVPVNTRGSSSSSPSGWRSPAMPGTTNAARGRSMAGAVR